MNYIKLFENFSENIKDTIQDILIDWYDFTIETLEYENKLYVFIISPTNSEYFTINDEMKGDISRVINYICHDNYRLANLYLYPSILLGPIFKQQLLQAIENEYDRSIFIKNLYKNTEEIEIKGNKFMFKDDNFELTNKIAVGYLLLIFSKN